MSWRWSEEPREKWYSLSDSQLGMKAFSSRHDHGGKLFVRSRLLFSLQLITESVM